MVRHFVVFILLAASAAAQTAAPKPQGTAPKKKAAGGATAKPAQKPPAELPGSTPVMTVSGVCALPASPATPARAVPNAPNCTRAVTKADLERLVEAMGPQGKTADKMRVAEYYARGLLIENEARRLGLESDPMTRTQLWMARVGVYGEALHRYFQKKFDNVTDAQIEAYYEKNKSDLEEVTVRRVVIPKVKPPAGEDAPDSPSAAKQGPPPTAEQIAAAQKAHAESLLERAKKGEDLEKLQKEAFEKAAVQAAPPTPNPVAVRRGMLPENQEPEVFAVAAGQFSKIFDEPSALMFYKVESKRVVPLAEVRDDIRKALIAEQEQNAIDELFRKGRPNLNPAYFAREAKPPEAPKEAPPAEAAPETPEMPEEPKPSAEPAMAPPEAPQGNVEPQTPAPEAPKAEEPEKPKETPPEPPQ